MASRGGHHGFAGADGDFVEEVDLRIAGEIFPLGDAERPFWVGTQNEIDTDLPSMQGYEDLLLGRDFMTQHRLLLMIDGAERSISLLAPQDPANQELRDSIVEAWEG